MNEAKKTCFQPKNLERMTRQLADSTKVARCAALRDFRDLSCFASLRLRKGADWVHLGGHEKIYNKPNRSEFCPAKQRKKVFFSRSECFLWMKRKIHLEITLIDIAGLVITKRWTSKRMVENHLKTREAKPCACWKIPSHVMKNAQDSILLDIVTRSGQPLQDGSYKLIRAGFCPFTNTKYLSDLCQITLLQG